MNWKKIVLRTLLGLAILLAVFAVAVTFQPAEYRVTRSASVQAPAPIVFGLINDFHKWEDWSPWAKLDPNVKNTFSGAATGTGAVFAWEGNNDVGAGQMKITESRPSELIRMDLEFIKPFASSCLTEFAFKPEGNKTAITWTMSGKNNFIAKAFCMFMNMDKMIGADFEKGLASIKTLSEAAAKKL